MWAAATGEPDVDCTSATLLASPKSAVCSVGSSTRAASGSSGRPCATSAMGEESGGGGGGDLKPKAERRLTAPSRIARKVRKAGVSRSPEEESIKKVPPMAERKRLLRLNSVRGNAIARPGWEGNVCVEAVTAEK